MNTIPRSPYLSSSAPRNARPAVPESIPEPTHVASGGKLRRVLGTALTLGAAAVGVGVLGTPAAQAQTATVWVVPGPQNVPGYLPGSGYIRGPESIHGYLPHSGHVRGPGSVPGYLPGTAPRSGPETVPGYLPGSGYIPGPESIPGYLPGSGHIPGPESIPGYLPAR